MTPSLDTSRIEVLHADPFLIVVDKPAGMLSVPARNADPENCLIGQLRREHPDLRIVHRLDADTSGLMVLALDAETHRRLSRLFEQRQVEKTYVARVAGHPDPAEGVIDLPIRKDMSQSLPPRHLVDPEAGKPSVTRYRTLRREPGASLLELKPQTGRSHQLRVHLTALGHPIAGDPIYAPPEVRSRSGRLQLHACRLAFVHPVTGRTVDCSSPAPF